MTLKIKQKKLVKGGFEQKIFLEKVKETLLSAIAMTDEFRIKEGEILKNDLIKRKDLIMQYLDEVAPFEDNRHENIKNKLIKNFVLTIASQWKRSNIMV